MLHKKDIFILFLLTLFAFSLRYASFHILHLESDEHTALLMRGMNIREVWVQVTKYDCHPPLYYAILNSSFHIFHNAVYGIRMPSIVFGALAIPATYLLAHRIIGRGGAFLSALFLCINPLHISLSQLGRMYSLLALFAVSAPLFFLYAINEPRKKRWHFLAYLALTGGLYTQYVFWALWASLAFWLFLTQSPYFYDNSLTKDNQNRKKQGFWTGFNLLFLSALSFLPWPLITAFVAGSSSLNKRVGVFFPFDLAHINQYTGNLICSLHITEFWPLTIATISLVFLVIIHLIRPINGNKALMLCIFLVPFALHIIMSVPMKRYFYSTVFYPRYMAEILPGLSIMAGAAMGMKNGTISKIPPGIIFFASLGGTIRHLFLEQAPYMEQIAELIENCGKKGDFLLLSGTLSEEYWRCYEKNSHFPAYSPGYWNPWHNLQHPMELQEKVSKSDEYNQVLERERIVLLRKMEENGVWSGERIWFIEEDGCDPHGAPIDRLMRRVLNNFFRPKLDDIKFAKLGLKISLWEPIAPPRGGDIFLE